MLSSKSINKELIGKYIIDKREESNRDIGKIIGIKGYYYLINWIRIERESEDRERHQRGKFAMYKLARLMENFIIVDSLSEAMVELI